MSNPSVPAITSQLKRRLTERMHAGRMPVSGAVYFLTLVTRNRQPWLGVSSGRAAMLSVIQAWHGEGDGAVLAAIVMPDHVHVLIRQGASLPIGRVVARWKSQAMKACNYIGSWQRDFWEHRLRTEESWEDYGLYMLLNPYRAGLAKPEVVWPGWYCPEPRGFAFISHLERSGVPPREWVGWPDDRFEKLSTGE